MLHGELEKVIIIVKIDLKKEKYYWLVILLCCKMFMLALLRCEVLDM